ncbi:TPA: AAA family ATPase [Pasteurella multocida]|nr:AAA family ATPase [Pasteurella multocida]HDR1506819.1 AAA family ATPase [Pasteurella multocida]
MKYPGSNWWRFDFHNHTPASNDYANAERTILPRDWLLAYMRSNVDCVAITDHNCGDWIDCLKNELNIMRDENPRHADYRDLYLFPGVELTSADGIHILAIFDPTESASKIHGILALSKYNNDQNNAHGICQEGAASICDHIHNEGGIVVLAHAEEINGLFNATTTAREFVPRSDRSIEQVLGKSDAIEIHDEEAQAVIHFQGKIKGRPIVNGSDAHKTSNAGTRWVWLKMAQPSIEGLKLALLDPESSLLQAQDEPKTPLYRITSLQIEQLHLRRQSLNIDFSPWFNAIIGGRGSGKSTLLEALRLAVAREADIHELGSVEDSDVARAFSRFRALGGVRGDSGMVRQDTVLKATVEKYDPSANTKETYSFTWKPDKFQAQRLECDIWQDTGLTVEQAAKIFPVKVFSQKQIFELAERPSALLNYIDRAPEVKFHSWQEEYTRSCQNLRDLRFKERTLMLSVEKKAALETEYREISRKALAYQQSNIAGQVKQYQESQKAQKIVNDFIEQLLVPVNELHSVLQKNIYKQIRLGDISLQNTDVSRIQQQAEIVANDLDAKYQNIIQTIEVMRQQVDIFKQSQPVTEYFQQTSIAISNYQSEVARLKEEGVGTAQEAENALKRKQELEDELDKINTQQVELINLRKQIVKAYARLKMHRRKLTRSRQHFVDNVLVSNSNLRITICEQEDIEQSNDEFRSILRLQGNSFLESILAIDDASGNRTGLLSRLISDDIHDPVHKRVTNLKLGLLERSNSILGQTLHGKLVTAINRLNHDDDNALLEWFPHDLVKVEFRRSERDSFQSLERASAGQKTSSILSFVLSHGDEPLLLDQPEDDLDNALISKLVVDQIRNNKFRRQIIIVTHNPNIVVNGDAELVLPMVFAAGQIQQNDAGGLQELAVRERICNIMEGGRAAFYQRYKRILEDLDSIN